MKGLEGQGLSIKAQLSVSAMEEASPSLLGGKSPEGQVKRLSLKAEGREEIEDVHNSCLLQSSQ